MFQQFQRIYHDLLTSLILLAIFIVVTHHLGWLDRWIWFVLESEVCKACNGAQVTLGSFTLDWSEILQGKITLQCSNVIIHTPQRSEWKWDSPLIARIGKATIQCNAPITAFHAVFLRRDIPIEAYTILVCDVQVFVERRDSLINVFLLNPTIQLPRPPPVKCENQKKFSDNVNLSSTHNNNTERPILVEKANNNFLDHENQLQPMQEGTTTNVADSNITNSSSAEPSSDHNAKAKAKILVNEMLQAVQVLGGAAARGKLPGAIKQQGLELVDKLRGFRDQENLEEGIRVMQQMHTVGIQSIKNAHQLILPKADNSKKKRKKKVLYIRVGRIVIDDMRIFTKDSWINNVTTTTKEKDHYEDISKATSTSLYSQPNTKKDNNTGNKSKVPSTVEQNGRWNKPIYIERMVLRSSELSPSMSMTDGNNLPAIYQSVDKVVEVVSRRLLVEIAKTKTNTGKLFSTTVGEVLSVMVSNPTTTSSKLSL